MTDNTLPVPERKAALRREIRLRREAMSRPEREGADRAITAAALSLPEYDRAASLFCYVSLPSEPATDRVLTHALESGKRVFVPRITGEGTMEPVEIRSLSDLQPGKFGIREPIPGLPAGKAEDTDLALIPCVSCTRHGERLGRGGGYYDRFLAAYQGAAALICYEALLSDSIPRESHDIPVPIVVTDREIYR